MSYQLDPDQPVADEVRRVWLEQLDHARSGLVQSGASQRAVHEARKSCKRCRALYKLVQDGLPPSERRGLDRGFRDAARHLGPVRDADVMQSTLVELGHEPHSAPIPDREERGRAAAQALQDTTGRVRELQMKTLDRDTLVQGFTASWRTARKTRCSPGEDDPEAFHEWRKHVKRLHHHAQLLAPFDRLVLGGLARQLDELQEALGDHHDLYVLDAAARVGADAGAQALRVRSAELEERAASLGRWIIAAPASKLETWLRLTVDR